MEQIYTERYGIGEIATVRNYDIFDPSPSSWNEIKRGTGNELKPGDTWTVFSDLNIYGQYNRPTIYYHFFDDDPKLSQKSDRWQVDFLQEIEVPEYKYNDFKCWRIGGVPYLAGETICVSNDIDMLPSCSYQCSISFLPGNGYGSMDDICTTSNKYLKLNGVHTGRETVYEHQYITLPQNQFKNLDIYTFNGWKIGSETYQEGAQILLDGNKQATAQWKYSAQNTIGFTCWHETEYNSAFFQQYSEYTLDVTIENPDYGSVSQTKTQYANVKKLTATVKDANYHDFNGWTVDGEHREDNPIEITIEEGQTPQVTAHFALGNRHTTVYLTYGDPFTIPPKDMLTRSDVRNNGRSNLNILCVNIGSQTKSLGEGCFSNCWSLKCISCQNGNDFTFGDNCFYKSNLRQVDFSQIIGKVTIGNNSFYGCQELTSLSIPQNVIEMGVGAFANCQNLHHIDISCGEYNVDFSDNSFYGCITLSGLTVHQFDGNGIISFGNGTFLGDRRLSSLDFTNITSSYRLPKIQNDTFEPCATIPSRTFAFLNSAFTTMLVADEEWNQYAEQLRPVPSIEKCTVFNVSTIANGKFGFNFSLGKTPLSVNWGDGNTSKKTSSTAGYVNHIFGNDGNYTVKVADGVKKLSQIVENGSLVVESIGNIGSTVTSITKNFFNKKSGLSSIFIPSTVDYIESDVFVSCYNLEINDDGILDQSGYVLGDRWLVHNCRILRLKELGETTELGIPEGVLSIQQNTFNFENQKMTKLTIPSSVEFIEDAAIVGLNSESQVTLDGNSTYTKYNNCIVTKNKDTLVAGYLMDGKSMTSLTAIGEYGCAYTDENNIVIPPNVVKIGKFAFGHMENLRTIDFTENKCFSLVDIKNNITRYNWCAYSLNGDASCSEITVKHKSGSFNILVDDQGNSSIVGNCGTVKALLVGIGTYQRSGVVSKKGIENDVERYERLLKVYQVQITKLKDQNATYDNINDNIEAILDSNPDHFIFMFCGSGTNDGINSKMHLYDKDMNDVELWQKFKTKSCTIHLIFGCSHCGSDDKTADFASSATNYFSSVASKPQMVVWNACSNVEESFALTIEDKESGETWRKRWTEQMGGNTGQCMNIEIIDTVNAHKYISYDEIWEELSDETSKARDNKYQYQYDERPSEIPETHWNGPTVQKAVVGDMDTSRFAFMPFMYKLDLDGQECELTYSVYPDRYIDGEYYYLKGKSVTVTVTYDEENYRFDSWSDGVSENPRTFVMNSDYELDVNATEIQRYALDIGYNDDKCTVKKNPDCDEYESGTEVTVTVTLTDTKYTWTWSDTGKSDNNRKFTMTEDIQVDVELTEKE